jgi:uncharacterized protein (DUF1810 family)
MENTFNLQRFVEAQHGQFEQAVRELRNGRKRSHWIWYVFPQVHGLGRSPISRTFAIASLAEARAYLDHPLLGPRLRECTELMLAIENRTANEILGSPDDVKFRSSMTLFDRAAGGDNIFRQALHKYFTGIPDSLTISLLAEPPGPDRDGKAPTR